MAERLSLDAKERVPAAFDPVAEDYDLLCALNPGYHAHLRRSAARLGEVGEGRVLDLCCGTGLSTAALRKVHPRARIEALDASAGMLERARAKGLRGVGWWRGDAMDPTACGLRGPFDAILMAYGLRNVPDPDLCLLRLRELLRPGGVLCVHDYSIADSRRARWVFEAVLAAVVLPLARVVTGRTELFVYLRESVRRFDGVEALQARMRRAGLDQVRVEPMGGWQRGVVHSFLGRRPVHEEPDPGTEAA